MVIAIALPLMFVVMAAQAEIPIVLYACDKTTCTYTKNEQFDHPFVTESIFALGDSEACPGKCANVHLQSINVHVVGNVFDLTCRVWGGNFCEWSEEAFSQKEALKRARER